MIYFHPAWRDIYIRYWLCSAARRDISTTPPRSRGVNCRMYDVPLLRGIHLCDPPRLWNALCNGVRCAYRERYVYLIALNAMYLYSYIYPRETNVPAFLSRLSEHTRVQPLSEIHCRKIYIAVIENITVKKSAKNSDNIIVSEFLALSVCT